MADQQEQLPSREDYFASAFGTYPLHVTYVQGRYLVDAAEGDIADACSIPASFTPDRVDIMVARAAAYGYVLEGLQ